MCGSVTILGLLTGVNSHLVSYFLGESEYCGHSHQPRKSAEAVFITQPLQENHTHKSLLFYWAPQKTMLDLGSSHQQVELFLVALKACSQTHCRAWQKKQFCHYLSVSHVFIFAQVIVVSDVFVCACVWKSENTQYYFEACPLAYFKSRSFSGLRLTQQSQPDPVRSRSIFSLPPLYWGYVFPPCGFWGNKLRSYSLKTETKDLDNPSSSFHKMFVQISARNTTTCRLCLHLQQIYDISSQIFWTFWRL